eukprot:scaffold121701_cov41-Prasinocladus_malaysianus.AAC.2
MPGLTLATVCPLGSVASFGFGHDLVRAAWRNTEARRDRKLPTIEAFFTRSPGAAAWATPTCQ